MNTLWIWESILTYWYMGQKHGGSKRTFSYQLATPTDTRVFLVAQLVKNTPAMQETLVQFLGQEDLLEKG